MKPSHPSDPEIERIESSPARIKWADDLAVHATFEGQMHGGAGPFTIERRGQKLDCVRFMVTEGGVHIYAAPYGGGTAWPLTEAETQALVDHTKWTPRPA